VGNSLEVPRKGGAHQEVLPTAACASGGAGQWWGPPGSDGGVALWLQRPGDGEADREVVVDGTEMRWASPWRGTGGLIRGTTWSGKAGNS
jgi:hypothetical protein